MRIARGPYYAAMADSADTIILRLNSLSIKMQSAAYVGRNL
jgi:hypothetical protein